MVDKLQSRKKNIFHFFDRKTLLYPSLEVHGMLMNMLYVNARLGYLI